MRPVPRFVITSIALAALASCSSAQSTPAAGPTVRFDGSSAAPGFMAVPFPTDAYLAGGVVTNIDMSATVKENPTFLAHELAKQDGFSRVTMSLFYVDDPSKGLDDNNEPTGWRTFYLYHRAATGDDAILRLRKELSEYRRYPVHQSHQAAMGDPEWIGVAASDPAEIGRQLASYAQRCHVVLKPLPRDAGDLDEWRSLIRFFAPTS